MESVEQINGSTVAKIEALILEVAIIKNLHELGFAERFPRLCSNFNSTLVAFRQGVVEGEERIGGAGSGHHRWRYRLSDKSCSGRFS